MEEDESHILLYHADVPEILLEMIRKTLEIARRPKFQCFECLPFLAMEVLTTFLHPKSLTSMHVPEKLFNDSREGIGLMVNILRGQLTWFDTLAVTRFFSIASLSPPGIYFIMTHLDTFKLICELVYRSTKMVEEKIGNDDVTRDEAVISRLKTFRTDPDLNISARLFSHIAMHNAIIVFRHTIKASLTDPQLLFNVMKVVDEAEVVRHFSSVVKHLMIWVEPGQYLNHFLAGIRYCVDIPGAMQELFLDDIDYSKEHRLSVGIDSFKYWKHETRYPARLTWFLTHAFALRDEQGSGWCIVTLCHLLKNGNWRDVERLIESCGSELMDLAHLLDIDTPERTSVQSTILEALLRFGGFSYYEFGKGNFHKGLLISHFLSPFLSPSLSQHLYSLPFISLLSHPLSLTILTFSLFFSPSHLPLPPFCLSVSTRVCSSHVIIMYPPCTCS